MLDDWRKKARIRALFYSLDKDGSGRITVDEAQEALATFGVQLNRETARQVIENYDADNDGSLDFEEFSSLFDRVKLEEIFDQIDTDHSGSIELSELRILFAEFGVELGAAQVNAIISKLDTNEDGIISKAEFFEAFDHIPELDLEEQVEWLPKHLLLLWNVLRS